MRRTDIAIVGVACRLPGAADVGKFWDLLYEGRDAVAEAPPPARYALAGTDPVTSRRATGAGGFLDRIDEFDAGFFGISAPEACRLDPQQRLLLETCWEAVEDAGVPAERMARRTGVYVGCLSSDYWGLLRDAGITDLHANAGAGILGTPAGRICYALDLRGPSMMIDSSCSTALLAVHLACAGLRAGETDLALVGAATLLLSAADSVALAQAGVLAPRGRCRFGDAGADGYIRSEGIAVVALRRLADAVADGNRIYAVVLGSAVTNDGRSGGSPMAPGVTSQQDMLRLAYADAAVSAADIDYIEAHGAGTTVGDDVELAALGAVLQEAGRPPDRPCLVGSVKSNIGHTEGTAGLVGLMKTALALRNEVIPATLHVEAPNPVLAGRPLELVTERRPWPPSADRPRLAGISSFGISGTNVHVVLGDAPDPPPGDGSDPAHRPGHLLPLSARSPAALRELAGAYQQRLSAGEGPRLRDICHSAGTRRAHHDFRAAVVGADPAAVTRALRALASGGSGPGVVAADGPAPGRPRVAFVFPGQGWETPRMGRELLRTNEVFASAMRRCDEAIRAETGWSVREKLTGDGPIVGIDAIQPATWAVAVGLATVWQQLGVEPDVVIGHSMGEVAAATVCGALSIEDAASVMCRRSRLLCSIRGRGAMAFVQLGTDELEETIADRAGLVSVAASNSDRATVLTGDRDALAATVASLAERGVFAKMLTVEVAAHGPQVGPLLDPLRVALRQLRPRAARIPMYSTVRGEALTGGELDAGYWVDNLRQPVRFGPTVRSLLADGRPTLFVEMSARPQLVEAVRDVIEASGTPGTAIGSLRRDEPEGGALLRAVAEAYVAGCEPNWDVLSPGGRFVELPGYPWQRQRYWFGDGPALGPAARPASRPAVTRSADVPVRDVPVRDVPVAGVRSAAAPGTASAPAPSATRMPAPLLPAEPVPVVPVLPVVPVGGAGGATVAALLVHDSDLTPAGAPYLADSRVAGEMVVPAGSYLETVLTAAGSAFDGTPVRIDGFEHHEPLAFRTDDGAVLRVLLRTEASASWVFEVHGQRSVIGSVSTWTVLASGRIRAARDDREPPPAPVDLVRGWCDRHSGREELYRELDPAGEQWGERLRLLREVWWRPGEALALLDHVPPHPADMAGHRLHPALVEACGQALLAALPADQRAHRGPVLVDGAEEIRSRAGQVDPLWCHARLTGTAGTVWGDVRLLGRDGTMLVDFRGLRVRPVRWSGSAVQRTHPAPAPVDPRPLVERPLVEPPLVERVVVEGPVERPPVNLRPVRLEPVGGWPPAEQWPAPGGAVPDDPVRSMQDYLTDRIAELLQTRPEAIEPHRPLTALGMDSLFAARLRGCLEQDLAISLPVRNFLGGGTVADLAVAAVELQAAMKLQVAVEVQAAMEFQAAAPAPNVVAGSYGTV